MQDGQFNINPQTQGPPSPEYKPIEYSPFLRAYAARAGEFKSDSDLYENISIANQSGIRNWFRTFRKGVQETKIGVNSADLMDGLVKKANTQNALHQLDTDFGLGKINEVDYLTKKNDLYSELQTAYNDISEAQSYINKHRLNEVNHPISKAYESATQLSMLKGGDDSFGNKLRYQLPNVAGSSYALLAATVTGAFGMKVASNIVSRTLAGSEIPVIGNAAGFISGLTTVFGANAWARHLESKAEIGSQFLQDYNELKSNYLKDKPSGYQLSDQEDNDLVLKASAGSDRQYWKNMTLALSDTAQSLILAGGFSSMFSKFSNLNKLTRLLSLGTSYYAEKKLEGMEEGLQYAFQTEKHLASLGIQNTEPFFKSLMKDYKDVIGSMSFLGVQGKGIYADDKEFQANVAGGELLGGFFGGTRTAFMIGKDINAYRAATKELAGLNPVKTESPILKFKDEVYAKFFGPKSSALGLFSQPSEDRIFYLKEALKTLSKQKTEEGKPFLTNEELKKELADIDKAFDVFQKVNANIDNIFSPFGKNNKKLTELQKQAFRDTLFHNTLHLQRLGQETSNAETTMNLALDGQDIDSESKELFKMKAKLSVVEERLKNSFGPYEEFLKKQQASLKQAIADYKDISTESYQKTPEATQGVAQAIHHYYDAAETKFDYIQKQNELSKVKTWPALQRWSKTWAKTATESELKNQEEAITQDNKAFAEEVEKKRKEGTVDSKALNREVLERAGFGKSYIDTLNDEKLQEEADKALEEFKSGRPFITEDQLLSAIMDITDKPTLESLLSRPSARAKFNELGFDLNSPMDDIRKKAEDRIYQLLEQRKSNKIRKARPDSLRNQINLGYQVRQRTKDKSDVRDQSDYERQFGVRDGKATQKDVLKGIIDSPYSTRAEKELAKKLLEKTQNETIEFKENVRTADGKTIRPPGTTSFNPNTGETTVTMDLGHFDDSIEGNQTGTAFEATMLHELIHRFTIKALKEDAEARNKLNEIAKKAKEIADAEGKVYYGLKLNDKGEINLYEFVAEAMTSPEFQKLLTMIEGENKKSLWQEFVEAVRDILKRVFNLEISGTALEDVIDITTKLIEGQRKLGEVSLEAMAQNKLDQGLAAIDINSKEAKKQLYTLFQDLTNEVIKTANENEIPEATKARILQNISNKVIAKEDEINKASRENKKINFQGKDFIKGDYVVLKGYSEAWYIQGLSDDGLVVGHTKDATTRTTTLTDVNEIEFTGAKAEAEYFIEERDKPKDEEEKFVPSVLLKSAGQQFKAQPDGTVSEATDPAEIAFYTFLNNLQILDPSYSRYYGLLIQDGDTFEGVTIPHSVATQEYLSKGGKAGQIAIVVDEKGKPVLFDGKPVTFNVETPESILRRDSKKLAEKLGISIQEANKVKLQAAQKVKEARNSAKNGTPIFMRFKNVSVGAPLMRIVDQLTSNPISNEDAENVINIVKYLAANKNQAVKDFLFNYLEATNAAWKVSGGKIMKDGISVVPTVADIITNFEYKKSYKLSETNPPFNVYKVTGNNVAVAATYPTYQEYLKTISNLSGNLTQEVYNKYLSYEFGEPKTDKPQDPLPKSDNMFDEGNLFDASLDTPEQVPVYSNDLGLFDNLTTYALIRSIDKGIHNYLWKSAEQGLMKTIAGAMEDKAFLGKALEIVKSNLLAKLNQLKEQKTNQLEIDKIDDKINKITTNWKKITDYYFKKSYVFTFSKDINVYDEDGNLRVEGDDTIAHQKPFDSVGNEISPIDGASKEVKALVRGLSRFKKVNGEWVKVGNVFNVPDLVNFAVTWNNLIRNLKDSSTFEEMLDVLTKNKEKFPEYEELLASLRVYFANAKAGDFESKLMISKFYRDFSNPEIPVIEVLTELGLVDTVVKIDEATRRNIKDLKQVFLDNFRTKSKFKVKTTFGDIALSTKILDVNTNTKQGRIEFLEGLGFEFSPETLQDIEFDKVASGDVIKYFKAEIKAIQEAGVLLKDPITQLTKQTKYNKGLGKRINDIINLESKYTTSAPSLSMQNVENNTEYAISRPNFYTSVIKAINDVARYPTFQSLVGDPQFEFLDKPYAKTSHIMNMIFVLDSEVNYGKRRLFNKKPITLQLTNISGLVIEKAEGLKTTSLFIGDKLVADFNQLLKAGYKELTRAGDKSSAFGLRVSKFVQPGPILGKMPISNMETFKGNTGYGGQQMLNIMEKYLQGEVSRLILGRQGHLNNVHKLVTTRQRPADEFSLFAGILSDEVKNEIYAAVDALPELAPNTQDINEAANTISKTFMTDPRTISSILNFFKQEAIAKQASLGRYGFTFSNPYWLDTSLRVYTSAELLRAYVVNEFILHVEQTKIFNGDPVFFSNKDGEFHKRVPANGATGLTPITDNWWVEALNADPNTNLQSKLLGVNNPYSNVVKTTVFREQQVSSSYLDHWRQYLRNTGLTDDQIKRIVDPYSNRDIKEADAQGWITMDFYRSFKLSISSWTIQQEAVYDKISKGEELSNEEVEALNRIFPAIKAQYSGPLAHFAYHVPAFHKFSLMPLIPSAIKGTALESLNERMIRNNLGYALMESGSKVGSISNDGLEGFYENRDQRTMVDATTPFKNENLIFMHFLKEQVQIEPELHDKVIYGTQFRKLLFQNTYSNGKAVNNRFAALEKEYSQIIEDLTDFEKNSLIYEMGVEPVIKDNKIVDYKVVDENKLVKKLIAEIDKRKLNNNVREFFEMENGKLKYPIDASLNHQQVRNLVMSMINNRLIRQTIKGDMMILGSGTGYERLIKPTDADLLEYGTNGLRFYYIKDGKTRKMQVKVAMTGDFTKLLSFSWNGEKIQTRERLNQAIKDENWMKENAKAVTMLGYRIPTQGLNSIEIMEVAEFLPAEAGNILIVPTEIVTKSGADFDIDKLNIFKPSLKVDRAGNGSYIGKPSKKVDMVKAKKVIEKQETLDTIKTLQQVVDDISVRLKDENSEYWQRELVGAKAELYDYQIQNAIILDELEEINEYKAGLYNRIIEIGEERLTDPASFAQLITPNSTDLIKPVIQAMQKGKSKKSYLHTNNLTSSTQEEKYLAGIPNKKALGIAAVANTFSQLFNKIGLALTGFYKGANIVHPMISKLNMGDMFLEDGTLKSEIESQMINAYVDVLNDDFISKANLGLDTAGAFFYLLHLGHDPQQLIYFFNNPIIKAYVQNVANTRSLISRNYRILRGLSEEDEKKNSADFDPYFDNVLSEAEVIKKIDAKARRDAFLNVVDPTDTRDMKEINRQGLRKAKQSPELFSKDKLKKDVDKSLEAFNKEEKLAILAYYTSVLRQSSELLNLQQVNNYDTTTSVNPIAHEYREATRQKLADTGLFAGDVTDVSTKTVVKPFNQYNLISKLMDTLMPVSLNTALRTRIVSLLMAMKDAGITDIDEDRITRAFINDWLYFLAVNFGDINGEKLAAVGKSLLFTKGLSDRLTELKTDPKWAGLRQQFPIIENLRADSLTTKDSGTISNISLYRDDNSSDYQNVLIEQFTNLAELSDPTYSDEDRAFVQKFFKDLALLGFVQSGLNKSNISFTDIIPNKLYVPMMSKVIEDFKAKTQAEQGKLFNEFASKFQSNNTNIFGKKPKQIPFWRFKDYQMTEAKKENTQEVNKDLLVTRIISGGQTGGDLGGLEGGRDLGVQTGGTAPPGWISGKNSERGLLEGFGLTEGAPDPAKYPKRTMKNVDDSDGTVAILWGSSVGTTKTVGYAQTHKWQEATTSKDDGYKPVLVITSRDPIIAGQQLRDFVIRNNIKVLNVAGHREQSQPGVQAFTRQMIVNAFKESGVSFNSELDTPVLPEGTFQSLLRNLAQDGLITQKC